MILFVVVRTKCDSGQQQMLLEAPVQLSQVSADAGKINLIWFYSSFCALSVIDNS